MTRHALIVAVLAVGCRTAPVELPREPVTEGGGSRIRAKFLNAEGGARHFTTFHDATLGIDCSADLAEDGVERCLPTPRGSLVFYADAACTHPYATPNESCTTPPSYVETTDSDMAACASRLTMWKVGARLPPTRRFQRDSKGGCVPGTVIDDQAFAIARVSPETFVAFDRHDVNIGSVIVSMRRTADGASQVAELTDAARGKTCVVRKMADERLQCAPKTPLWSEPAFGDASCSQPCVAMAAVCDASAVPMGAGLAELGAEMPLYQMSPSGACVAESDRRCFEVGAPIHLASLPLVARTTRGTGRVQSVDLVIDGQVVGHEGFVDRAGVGCTPWSFADGSVRCVTTNAFTAAYTFWEPTFGNFSDPTCTTRLAGPPFGGTGVPTTQLTLDLVSACGGQYVVKSVQKLSGPFTGSVMYRGDGLTCRKAEPTDYGPLYTIEGDAPFDTFAPLTTSIE